MARLSRLSIYIELFPSAKALICGEDAEIGMTRGTASLVEDKF
jgi:hypothetical protein